ncbi:unknown [Clostridium sp. CAG:167]|jgi:hypothetical protein|nr:unknown [Clostridium sp. CAG:167]
MILPGKIVGKEVVTAHAMYVNGYGGFAGGQEKG